MRTLARRRTARKRVSRTSPSSTLDAVSGLETLPPDQRAVLQLILVQGRGYDDLATTLKLDASAVRTRAHAGADALVPLPPARDELDADTRGRVVDYLLGQQDDGERIVTFAELGGSPAACRWAQSLREQLADVAREELPEVPASAAVAPTNGSAPQPVAAVAVQPAAATTAPAATLTPPPATVALAPASPAPGGPTPPAAPRPPAGPGGSGSSRLGGAILIAGAAALAIVLAIVLIGGGDDDNGTPASTSAAQTQAQTQTQARTQPTTTPASGQQTGRIVAQVNLVATPAGGGALGVGLIQQASGRRAIAIQAQRLPANGAQDIYAVWLQGAAGSKFLGFVPRQVRADGTFTVTAALPANASSYTTVLITREGITAVPTAPGATILSGPLRLTS